MVALWSVYVGGHYLCKPLMLTVSSDILLALSEQCSLVSAQKPSSSQKKRSRRDSQEVVHLQPIEALNKATQHVANPSHLPIHFNPPQPSTAPSWYTQEELDYMAFGVEPSRLQGGGFPGSIPQNDFSLSGTHLEQNQNYPVGIPYANPDLQSADDGDRPAYGVVVPDTTQQVSSDFLNPAGNQNHIWNQDVTAQYDPN